MEEGGRETLQLFDLMFKLILKEASPRALVHFINGLFDKDYPPDSAVAFAATESVSAGEGKLERLTSDMILEIAGESFLIEAQINDDESIALRVFQYGFAHASRRREMKEGAITLRMPDARILYWETSRKTLGSVALRLIFPNGSVYEYEVKAFKVLDESVASLGERKLAPLFPFCLLKFRKEMKDSGTSVERRRELAGELKEMVRELEAALCAGRESGVISEGDEAMILERMTQMYEELYRTYPECKEARMELRERLRTHWQDYLQEGERRGIQLGERRGIQLGERRGEKRIIELLEQGCTLEEIKSRLAQEDGQARLSPQ